MNETNPIAYWATKLSRPALEIVASNCWQLYECAREEIVRLSKRLDDQSQERRQMSEENARLRATIQELSARLTLSEASQPGSPPVRAGSARAERLRLACRQLLQESAFHQEQLQIYRRLLWKQYSKRMQLDLTNLCRN